MLMILSKKDLKIKTIGKFGKLTPLYKLPDRITPSGQKIPVWRCKCDCGNITDVAREHLLRGNVKSCGCYKKICLIKDLKNQKFGNLTVISRIPHTKKWRCKCNLCGNIIDVTTSQLTQRKKTDCGCLKSVTQYTIDGERVKTYKNMQEAASAINVTRQCINEAISKKIKLAGGYIWSKTNKNQLSDDELSATVKLYRVGKSIPYQKEKKDRRVIQYDIKGNKLNVYPSVKEASEKTNISTDRIYYNIRNKTLNNIHRSDDYIWKYHSQPLTPLGAK